MKKMRTTIEERIDFIKKQVQEKMKEMIVPTKENWVKIFNQVQKEKEIENHNATLVLENLTVNGKRQEVLAIYQEQNIDYIIVVHDHNHIDFYSFAHYYHEDEDCSLAEKVVKEDDLQSYQPFYTIHTTSDKDESGNEDDIYRFWKLKLLAILYGNMMCEFYNEKGMEETLLFEIKELVNKKVKELVSVRKKKIAKIHDALQNNNKVGVWELKRIKVKEPQTEPDEMDLFFQQKLNISFEAETEEDCNRNALIMKKEDMHYVILIDRLEDNEYAEDYSFCFHVCHPQHDLFTPFDMLVNNYDSYEVRSILEYRYTHTKKPKNHIFETGSSLDDIHYFSHIETIIKEIERTQL